MWDTIFFACVPLLRGWLKNVLTYGAWGGWWRKKFIHPLRILREVQLAPQGKTFLPNTPLNDFKAPWRGASVEKLYNQKIGT